MLESILSQINSLVYQTSEGMVHPGLSAGWVLIVLVSMLLLSVWLVRSTAGVARPYNSSVISVYKLPFIGKNIQRIITRPTVITLLRIFTAAIFLLVIAAGLFGTQVPERNIATTLTWTLWWSGVVISVFFVGSAWCAICPWDAIATWLVRRRLWKRGSMLSSLNLRVPKAIRNIWPALGMFVVLTWLELGYGVTVSPYATALLALLIVVLATMSLAVYERKAFCRYFCAVGRTLGAYGGIAPIALRPIDNAVCANCKTLECFNGSQDIEPCPTHLVMGSLKQNTYCTSCGACTQSCPHQNVSWQIRNIGDEITYSSRPHWDESWFILGLLSLTIFHGFTMMPYWEGWMQQLAYFIGDSGRLLTSFSIGMGVAMLIPVLLYSACITWLQHIAGKQEEWKRVFSSMALSVLPLAFAYHIAHNLSHLVRESQGFLSIIVNPFGTDTLPLSMHEIHMRHMNPAVDDSIVFALQATLILFGFWMALKILRHRLPQLNTSGELVSRWAFMPMLLFISSMSMVNLWLLMQPMIMRM